MRTRATYTTMAVPEVRGEGFRISLTALAAEVLTFILIHTNVRTKGSLASERIRGTCCSIRPLSILTQALPPGRVPHVRGLSRTWVEYDLFPMLSPPVYTYLQEKKKEGASPIFFNPCTRKSANVGHPSRGLGFVEAGKAEDAMGESTAPRDGEERRVECW